MGTEAGLETLAVAADAQEWRKKSTHKAEVVPFVREPHPNPEATLLDVVRVYGYTCCIRRADWPPGTDRAIYIVPDSLVDVRRPEFAFLAPDANADGKARVKAKRFKGVVSYGLLIPAPPGAEVGQDFAEQLGVERYEPPEPSESSKEKFVVGGEQESGPDLDTGPSMYDVEAFERYAHEVLAEGEVVVVSEKLDGSNARFVYHDGRFWVKSRKNWVKRFPDYSHVTVESLVAKGVPEEKAQEVVARAKSKPMTENGFWKALGNCPQLQAFLVANPGTTVFGEVYGNTNRLKYGFPEGNRFAAFDLYENGKFVDPVEAWNRLAAFGVPQAPLFNATGDTKGDAPVALPYSFDLVKTLSEGKTKAEGAKAGVIREGVVVRPLSERWHRSVGRVVLKCVNPEFISKA